MALINVPLSGQTLGQTRVPINTNFSVISTAFEVDHVAYNASGQGKHKWITFPVQTQATAQAALIYPDIGLYSALNAITGINELYFRNSGNNPSDTPLTASVFSETAGWAYMPCGLIIKWGFLTCNPGPATTAVNANQGPQIADNAVNQGILNVQITNVNTSLGSPVAFAGRVVGVGNGNRFNVGNSTSNARTYYYYLIATPA